MRGPDLAPVRDGRAVALAVLPMNTPPAGGWDSWADRLDAAEQARAARFRQAADREAYIAVHALLRALLSALPGAPPPQDWRFAAEPAGRPVALGLGLGVSLSHTGGMVACAVGPRETGVDVEALDRAVAPEVLAPSCLTQDEAAAMLALPVAARPGRFLRLWTLKEAVAKATGEGLSRDLTRLGFLLDPPLLAEGEAAGAWMLAQWQPDARHVAALAVRHGAGRAAPALLHVPATSRAGWPA
jgi:4'-phosphopantetheinyl transferase